MRSNLATIGVEYSTPFHLEDGMLWSIPNQFVGERAIRWIALECYGQIL